MLENGFYISIHKEKQIVHINCINNNTTLDCKTIHNVILKFIRDNEAYQDVRLQDLYSYELYVFLDSILLQGSKETKSNPLFFGELDKNGVFAESKPIYHLINEIDSNSIESTSNNIDSNNSLSTLQVFLGSNTLTLLNYSLLDSSLNIKLESKSTESKEILEREKAQREKQKDQDSQTKDSITSTAMLHPILEDNEIKCPHNGAVKLKSNICYNIFGLES